MNKFLLIIATLGLFLVACEPPKTQEQIKKEFHKYSIWKTVSELGEYDTPISQADHISSDGNCIIYWWEGQSKDQPAGIVCGKVHANQNY